MHDRCRDGLHRLACKRVLGVDEVQSYREPVADISGFAHRLAPP
jgi:hypothetical protein